MSGGCGVNDRKRKMKSGKTTDLYDSALRCGPIIHRSEGFLCQFLFFGFRSTIRHCRSASLRSQSSVAHWSSLPGVSEQKDRFRKYLIQRKNVKFSFDGTAYCIRIIGCDVFPQGFAAVADKLAEFKGPTMLCGIGNGTMNICPACR